MKILHLKLNNFLSYRGETDIRLEDVSICAIIGQNGAGKSTLLEAVTYALFGQTRASSEEELGYGYNSEYKRWLVNEFGVELFVKIGDMVYAIERKRYQKKSGTLVVSLAEPSGKVTQVSGVREGQEYINKMLGMDYQSFVSSVIMRQDDYEAFMKMAPGAAKEVLMKIIGIGQFEDKREIASEKAREISLKIAGLETAISLNEKELRENQISEADVKALEKRAETVNKEVEKKQADLQQAEINLKKVKENLDRYHESIQQIDALEKEMSKMGPMILRKENELDRLIGESGMKSEQIFAKTTDQWRNTEMPFIENALLVEGKEMADRRDKIVEGETMLKNYRAQINDLRSRPQKCLLGKEECDGILKQQCTDKVDEVTKLGLALKTDLEQITIEQDQIAVRIDDLRAILIKTRAAAQVSADMPMLNTWKESRDRAAANKAQLESYLQDHRDVTLDDATSMEFEIKGYKNGIKVLQDEAADIQRELGSIDARKAARKRLHDENEKMRKMIPEQAESLFIYETLKKALSKDGIPALMIETVVPQLEGHANELLDRLTNGQIRVEFRLQKKLKSGGFADSFEIYVTDEQGTRSVAMYSGGEKYRIILAIHSAFSRYLIHRSGTPLKFLCIDEPTGLDDQGLERFVETLGGLRGGYEQIFVITHLKSLMEYFPQTLMVEKTPTGSVVRAQGIQVENKSLKKVSSDL
jgi:exonuclease SbcC